MLPTLANTCYAMQLGSVYIWWDTSPYHVLHLPTYNYNICGKDKKILLSLVGCVKPNLGAEDLQVI
jgi:hypothetical protein